jgi:hypothetical protein
MTRQIAADFLEDTLQALPYRVHTVLMDNGLPAVEMASWTKRSLLMSVYTSL